MAAKFTYADVLKHIAQLTGGKPNRSPHNIEITTRLAKAMDLPINRVPYVHIAGTKGKGSTSFLTANLLQAAGMKVGLFTSPHLVDVRERFLINGQMIPKDRFAEYWHEVMVRQKSVLENASSHLDRESASRSNYFRFLFLTSLFAFEAEKVDVVVYEVGVGGRIDSTNIITPKVCGITSLGMDHMDILGPTISHIATEKAGIMKKGVPCYVQPQVDYPETEAILKDIARTTDVPYALCNDEIINSRRFPPMRMGGDHMKRNAQLAIALSRTIRGVTPINPLEPFEEHVLKTAQFPGRSQILPVRKENAVFFVDGAHTPESMAACSNWFSTTIEQGEDVARTDRPTRNVLLMFTTRDAEVMLPPFQQLGKTLDKVIFAPAMDSRTGAEKDQQSVADLLFRWQHGPTKDVPSDFKQEAFTELEELLQVARTNPDGSVDDGPLNILVTGSLYMVGNAMTLLGTYAQKLLSGTPSPTTSPKESD